MKQYMLLLSLLSTGNITSMHEQSPEEKKALLGEKKRSLFNEFSQLIKQLYEDKSDVQLLPDLIKTKTIFHNIVQINKAVIMYHTYDNVCQLLEKENVMIDKTIAIIDSYINSIQTKQKNNESTSGSEIGVFLQKFKNLKL